MRTSRFLINLFFILLSTLVSCTIYQSPERKEFESEAPQFKIQNFKKTENCTTESVESFSTQSRYIGTLDDVFIWEHHLQDQGVIFEGYTTQNKEYCIYEYSQQ